MKARTGRFKSYLRLLVLLAILVSTLVELTAYLPLAQEELPSKPIGRAEHHPKIESTLEELIEKRLQGKVLVEVEPPQEPAKEEMQPTRGSFPGPMISVILEPEGGRSGSVDQLSLETLGAVVEARSRSLIRASVPADKLREVADRVAGISFIRRPYPFMSSAANKVSEAVVPIGGLLFHSRGFEGQGVKVAVIDVGFGGLSWASLQGELPQRVIADAQDYTREGLESKTNHGTAVAEVVHDIAPQARLYLKKVKDELDLENAMEDSIRQGVDIIVHSVGWANTNFGDGQGMICAITDQAREGGILWVNAAGNQAQMHWQGPFYDWDGDGWNEFSGDDESINIKANPGSMIQVFLTWNDWPRSCQDYDLFLFNARGDLLASSQNYQTCNEPPTEEISFPVLEPGVYHLQVLARNRLKPVKMKITSFNHVLEYAVPQGSLMTPADCKGVLAVGTVDVKSWETGPQEPFSSQGPTTDGRVKPDITGPDDVTTLTMSRFIGSSAAAPHVAGAAALLLSKDPRLTVEQLQSTLEGNAIDMGAPGKDPIYGAGRLNLSLGRVTAARRIETLIQPGNKVARGSSFLVSLSTEMPPSRFGGITIKEQLPPSFEIVPLESDGAIVNRSRTEWVWPIVDPGEIRRVTYKVEISEDQEPGLYAISGTVNGRAIAGDEVVEVIEPLTIEEAVAHWDAERRKIDLKTDEIISAEQIQQALSWWLKDEQVPETDKIIEFVKAQELVARWLTRTSIGEFLPQSRTPLRDIAAASRIIEVPQVVPGGTLEVAVEIQVKGELNGMGLVEILPRGWEVTPLESGGAMFKVIASRAQIEWLWTETINAGEVRRVKYMVKVPAEAKEGLLGTVTGILSSASPNLRIKVVGDSEVEITGEKSERLRVFKILSAPNPLNTNDSMTFIAEGSGIKSIQLEVYSLAGMKLFGETTVGNALTFNATNEEGQALANGVYLYVVTLRGAQAEVWRSKVQRLVILR